MAVSGEKWYDVYMEIAALQPNAERAAAPRKRGRTVLLCLLIALLLLAVLALWVYHGVSPVVRWEYGQGMPSGSVFCQGSEARCISDEDCTSLGVHVVQVITAHRTIPCLLIVQDTTAPVAAPVRLSFPSGYVPTPDEFITDLVDADRVGVSFAGDYDFSIAGEQVVRIHMEDGSGNENEVTAMAAVHAAVDRVVAEAGDPAPGLEQFLTDGFHGELLDAVTDEMMRTPGEYPLRVRCLENGRIFTTILAVRDTVSPVGSGTLRILAPGAVAAPEDYLTDTADMTELSYAFAVAPDPDSREIQDIVIRVTDAGGNETLVPAQALFSAIGAVTVEAKNDRITGADLGRPDAEPEDFTANVPGTYALRVRIDGEDQLAMVTLVDTTAPALSLREGTFYTRHDLAAADLVQAEDVSEVSLSFVDAPDQDSDQPQTFTVRAVDALGNEAAATFSLTLKVDAKAPVLYGVVDRHSYVGEPIAYLQEAYAEDDVDGRVELKVDSQVILTRKGKYTVTFSATDKSGNTVSKKCTYTLVEPSVTDEQVREMARTVLSKILTPDMVTAEKLKAVFDYVHGHVTYVGSSDKADWRKEALRGYREGRGDCFTVYSLTRALLDELEIPYMSVTRKSSTTRHYWVIVNIGTGWYHFDPLRTRAHKSKCFMCTTKQCLSMARSYFWRFHEENFPPIATEPFDYEAVVQMERDGLLP